MQSSVFTRGAAVAAAVAIVGLSAAPASAATVSQASSSAVSVDLAGSAASVDSGTYKATYDGKSTSTTGTSKPLVSALSGQTLVSNGALTQEADASKKNGKSFSEACAGLVGDGTGNVGVGSGRCLQGDGIVHLDLGTLDLSQFRVSKSDLYKGMDDKVAKQIAPVQGPVAKVVDSALAKATAAAGHPSLRIDLRSAESACQAFGASTAGDATLNDASAYATVPVKGNVPLLDLPAHPQPNAKLVTNLGPVVASIVSQVRTTVLNTVRAALKPVLTLNDKLVDQIVNQIVDQATAKVKDAFSPLQENVLDLTLNKQVQTKKGISVTAIDLDVLPAAQKLLKTDIAHVAVGQSVCGPNTVGAVGNGSSSDTTGPQANVNAGAQADGDPQAAVTVHPKGAPAKADVHLMSAKAKAGIGALVALVVLAAAGVGTRFFMLRARRA